MFFKYIVFRLLYIIKLTKVKTLLFLAKQHCFKFVIHKVKRFKLGETSFFILGFKQIKIELVSFSANFNF